MRKLIQEIHNGKNIKENLKHYADIAVKTYVDYGTLEMTFLRIRFWKMKYRC